MILSENIKALIRAGDHLFRHLDGEMVSSREEAKSAWDKSVAAVMAEAVAIKESSA